MLSKPGCCHVWRPGVCMWLARGVRGVKDVDHMSDLGGWIG